MSDDPPKDYSIEPEGGSEETERSRKRAEIERSGEPDPFALADEPPAASERPPERPSERPSEPPARSSVKALDVCPNCGAPMPDAKTVVCMRCGYDLKRLKVVKTATGEVYESEDEKDEKEEKKRPPLSTPGRGDLWLPGGIAAVAGVILLFGCLLGAEALFPGIELGPDESVAAGARFTGLLRHLLLVVIWTMCGFAALLLLSRLLERRLGDLKLTALRLLGIAAAMRLAAFIDLTRVSIEWTLEAVAQAITFFVLSMLLFKLTPRDAATATGGAIIAFVGLWVLALGMTWASG